MLHSLDTLARDDGLIVGRAEVITSFVKRHDPELYCEKNGDGKLCVYRKGFKVESYDVHGTLVHFVRPAPYMVLSLTTDWGVNSEPCDRGLLPILHRLNEIDLWNRDLVKEISETYDRDAKSRERAVDNQIESYLIDHRREFASVTNDILTHSVDKTENRRN